MTKEAQEAEHRLMQRAEAGLQRSIHLMYSDCGDWVGLYLDGKLVYEGHGVPVDRLLAALGISFTHEERDLSELGGCPSTLERSEVL